MSGANAPVFVRLSGVGRQAFDRLEVKVALDGQPCGATDGGKLRQADAAQLGASEAKVTQAELCGAENYASDETKNDDSPD